MVVKLTLVVKAEAYAAHSANKLVFLLDRQYRLFGLALTTTLPAFS
jgi:hypothetical protein